MAFPVRACALVGRFADLQVAEPLRVLVPHLRAREITVLVAAETPLPGAMDGVVRVPMAELARQADLVIAIGGDGTLLYAAGLVAESGIPLLGINRGRLGFLTDVMPQDMVSCIDAVLAGECAEERRRLLNATGSALLAAPFAIVGYGMLIERLDFHVREVEIPVPNLPDGLDGLRLLHLSDIHLSAFLSEKDLARVIDTANELHPHLALVTGDLITAAGDPLETCLRQLARLRADAGILGCMGNHEDYAMVENLTEREGARLGIPFLRGRAQPLRFGGAVLNVAGVDYQRSGKDYLPGAERLVLPGAYNLLLSHNPDVFPVAVEKGYDLTLAGHTHGGQVTVEILHQPINAARFFTPFVYGLYRRGAAAEYVTRGIGTIGIPARIGAPPEIALLRLRKA